MTNAIDEIQLAQLYRDLCTASIMKDADGIRATLADNYTLIHMTGMRQSRESYIEAVLDGTLNYYESIHDSIDVTISKDGQSAHVRGKTKTTAAVFGGKRRTWQLQQDLKAEKHGGIWGFTESHASTYI